MDTQTIPDYRIKLRDGRKLGYAEYGDPKGKPAFYFHGWPGSRFSGMETHEAAKKVHARVISIDRPGYGLSDYQEGRTLLDWPDDVVELADTLRIKTFALMGCSGGGPYVAACAYKIPKRISRAGIVVGLAPVNTPGNLDGITFLSKISWGNNHRFPIIGLLATINSMIGYKYFPRLSFSIGFNAEEDQAVLNNGIGERIQRSVAEAFRQGIKGPALDWKLYTGDWGFDLKDINVPVYLWYGAKDKNVSLNMGKYYHAQIPNSRLFIEPNGGHLFRVKKEEEILRTLVG